MAEFGMIRPGLGPWRASAGKGCEEHETIMVSKQTNRVHS